MLIRGGRKDQKSGKGCWTCKSEFEAKDNIAICNSQLKLNDIERKIGCDQALPSCNNCSRTNRNCEGYGLKLNWPEGGDGRRVIYDWDTNNKNLKPLPSHVHMEGLLHHFLNTTTEDMRLLSKGVSPPLSQNLIIATVSTRLLRPSRSLAIGYEIGFDDEHSTLLSYCE